MVRFEDDAKLYKILNTMVVDPSRVPSLVLLRLKAAIPGSIQSRKTPAGLQRKD
jgi:hypothetical protein